MIWICKQSNLYEHVSECASALESYVVTMTEIISNEVGQERA